MNLVAGATGILGTEICRRLAAQGKPVRGLVRATADAGKLENLRQLGVELVYGDLKDRASLDAACQGVEAVITTVSTTLSHQPDDSIEATDHEGGLNLVEAAQAAGVRHFIYTSYIGTLDAGPDPCPLTVAKRTVERAVQESGMTYTILRPNCFMEIWLGPALGFDGANARATLYGGGEGRLSWIALGDVAEFAVQSLDNPAAHDAVLELGGPEPLSLREVVEIFEKESGKSFELTHVPEEALRAQDAAATDSLQKSFARLTLSLTEDHPVNMGETLNAFPIRLTSVNDYAMHVLEHEPI